MSTWESVDFNAVVLSGGRSSRLGGTPKAGLRLDGHTLLDLACQAAGAAKRVVVVGPASDEDQGDSAGAGSGVGGREFVSESPRFGGPAAALAAAVDHLAQDATQWLLVLACDMPRIAAAIPELLAAVAEDPDYSVLAHDGERDQPLAAVYSLAALRTSIEAVESSGGVQNLSMKALLARVQWRAIDVPQGSTADVDTWADAQNLGVSGAAPT